MIPVEYKEVEYIETYGSQYSAVPFPLQSGDRINTAIVLPSSAGSSESAFLGADLSGGSAEAYTESDTIKFWRNFSGTETAISRNIKTDVVINVGGNLNGFYIGTYQTTRYPYTGSIYTITVTRSGNVVCNLVPCYRLTDDVIGWYDDINGVFYTNDGSGSYGKGPDVVITTYTIKFNSGAGSGSMPDQIVNIDETANINMCTFTYAGHDFAGWALSSGGTVVYENGAEIYNLAAAGETIILYATWQIATLKCILQYNKSENNKAVKELQNIREFNFVLKAASSIIDPVLLITGNIEDILNANYLTISKFGRSYFIRNVTSVRNGLIEITAHVDVLSSYIDQLKECEAIIHRQENNWNLYLDDGIFKTYQNPHIVVKKFPSGFNTQSFILAVAGD